MADLLNLAEDILSGRRDPSAALQLALDVHELGADVALVQSFSHAVTFRTGDGLVVVDTGLDTLARGTVGALRRWSTDPVAAIVYTHGHRDHVGGAAALIEDGAGRGHARPAVVGHEAVAERFARYDLTAGLNESINRRQFGQLGKTPPWPLPWVHPTTTFRDHLEHDVGGVRFELHHGRGETDDHAWIWVPALRAACVGDFFIWVFPNAGNPQKVQRFPREWANTLRAIAAKGPDLLLPAHGLPIAGRARIVEVLEDTAHALEVLVSGALDLMNEGATLDDVLHGVRLPADLAGKPFLAPLYDEPEFLLHNVWRLYGGWWDGNPAHLKPAADAALAREVAALAGGSSALVARALALTDGRRDEDLRLACHIVELAVQAAPDDGDAHRARAAVYARRRDAERSLMARGVFGTAAQDSEARLATGTARGDGTAPRNGNG